MRNLWFRTVCAALCLAVIFGPAGILTELREAAAAGATRVAIVTSLKGTVQVKKAGGAKYFNAFKNMSLNEGDMITTGKNSSVVLELASSKADQDSITIGENSQVQFTKLKEDTGTKAKMSVWAGSLWVKVKSISNAEDSFEVETPTAIMGVRGTHFILQVDPYTGKTTLVVASGVTAVNTPGSGSGGTGPKNVVNVYPTQQMEVDRDLQTDDPRALVQAADPETLVFTLPPDIIEAMVSNMADIRQENEELARQLGRSAEQDEAAPDPNANLIIVSSEDLAAYSRNMNALIVVILAEAVNQGVLPEETARSLVDLINASIEDPEQRFSLDDVPEYRKDVGIDQTLLEKAERARQRRDEQERRKEQRRQEKLEQNREKGEEIARNKSRQEEENQSAKTGKEQEAVRKYLDSLTEEERAALEQRVQERERERQERQGQTGGNPGTGSGGGGTPGGGDNPGGGDGPGDGDNPGGGDGPSPGPVTPSPAISGSVVTDSDDPWIRVLELKLSNFTDLFAFQADVEYDKELFSFADWKFNPDPNQFPGTGFNEYRNIPESPFKVELYEGWTPPAGSGYVVNAVDTVDHDDINGKVRYAVMKFEEGGVNVSGATVVRLPFIMSKTEEDVGKQASFVIKFKAVTVDANHEIKETTLSYTVTFEIDQATYGMTS
jgi:hypothetical protein